MKDTERKQNKKTFRIKIWKEDCKKHLNKKKTLNSKSK